MTFTDRMVWSGLCSKCGTLIVLSPTSEQSPDEQEAIGTEWPERGACFVTDCEGDIEWNGNDPVGSVLTPRML